METLKERLLEKIKMGSVSFAELSSVEGFKGDGDWQSANHENLILWCGVSEEAADVLNDLVNNGVVEMKTCHPMIYFFDGAGLSFPIAKRVMSYKKPRWLPVVFNLKG